MMSDGRALSDGLAVTRVRHPLKFRLAQVVQITLLTPHLIRVSLGGDELRGFESSSFDDHVKVFFPAPGTAKPEFPTPGAEPPLMRDFTPRRFDPVAGELDIEFVLHGVGPAAGWAARAQAGDYLGIGGPRGSMIIPTGYDWHLLIGDDTALPAMARRLEGLPRDTRAIVVAEVAGSFAQIDFKSHADMYVTWCHRDATPKAGLVEALAALPAFPPGQGYAWAAAEATIVRQLRSHLINNRGMEASRIRAAAYWKRGAQATHEVIEG